MAKHKSISQRLAKAGSLATKREIGHDWSANWQQEQKRLIHKLEQAISADDYAQLCIITGQLKAVTEKRFSALPKVIEKLTEPTE